MKKGRGDLPPLPPLVTRLNPKNNFIPRRHSLLGQTTTQPLSKFEHWKPWKYKQLWGLRPHPSFLQKIIFWFLFFKKSVMTFRKLPFLFCLIEKQSPEVFCKKRVLKNFVHFAGKHMCWSLFLTLSKTPSFFKNTYLEEQLRTTALVNQEKETLEFRIMHSIKDL